MRSTAEVQGCLPGGCTKFTTLVARRGLILVLYSFVMESTAGGRRIMLIMTIIIIIIIIRNEMLIRNVNLGNFHIKCPFLERSCRTRIIL